MVAPHKKETVDPVKICQFLHMTDEKKLEIYPVYVFIMEIFIETFIEII